MRFYFIVLAFIFLAGCSESSINVEKEITLGLSRKDLSKLFKGQELYSIKGIKTKFNGKVGRVNSIPIKNEHILKVELKKDYYLGSQHFILHSNLKYYETYQSLRWFLEKHKIYWPVTDIYNVKFKNKIEQPFVFIDIPTKEVIEFNGNRFLQMLSYSSFSKSLEIEESEVIELIDLSCYTYDKASLTVLKIYMDELGVNLGSLDAVKIIPNSITNKLQFVVDFSECVDKKDGISFSAYLAALNQLKPIDENDVNNTFEKYFREGEFLKEPNRKNSYSKTKKLSGLIELTEDLILDGQNVEVFEGTEFLLKNNAKIIMNGGVCTFSGTSDAPINVKGYEHNSVFFNNLDSLHFSNVVFANLSNWSDACKSLPSAITVYNSNVTFSNCHFLDNKRGDDMVNCFHSNFVFEDCLFSNVLSDAFDSDFSFGKVINTEFVEIGNDGVDCSGSDLVIINCEFKQVKDKAISAGENSNIDVSNSSIVESAIGFVAKDGSSLSLGDNIVLKDNDLDFAVFMKKTFYTYPSLDFQTDYSNYKYLFQKGSIISSSNKDLIYLPDVESKLYGNEFGKASK